MVRLPYTTLDWPMHAPNNEFSANDNAEYKKVRSVLWHHVKQARRSLAQCHSAGHVFESVGVLVAVISLICFVCSENWSLECVAGKLNHGISL